MNVNPMTVNALNAAYPTTAARAHLANRLFCHVADVEAVSQGRLPSSVNTLRRIEALLPSRVAETPTPHPVVEHAPIDAVPEPVEAATPDAPPVLTGDAPVWDGDEHGEPFPIPPADSYEVSDD